MTKVNLGLLVPFDENGHMIDRIRPWDGRSTPQWRQNAIFTDRLRFVCASGTSHLNFLDSMDKSLWTFPGDLDAFIRRMCNGEIEGRFAFGKKGMVYGLILAPEEEAQP